MLLIGLLAYIINVLWYNNKTVLLRDTVHQIPPGESAVAGMFGGSYHVTTQFYSYPVMSNVQNSINIYIGGLTSFNIWRHNGRALRCHGSGAWHNGLFLTTSSNVNCWVDVAYHVTRLWQAVDTKTFELGITGYLWTVSRSRVAKSRDKWHMCVFVYRELENLHFHNYSVVIWSSDY